MNKPDFKQTKENIKELSQISKSFNAIFDTTQLEQNISENAFQKKNEKAQERLADIPIERLKELKVGIRTNALQEYGIHNFKELSDISDREMMSINGIGEKQIESIRSIIIQTVEELSQTTTMKLEVPRDTVLLKYLWQYSQTKLLQKDAEGLLQVVLDELGNLHNIVILGNFRWIFSSSETKRRTVDASNELETFLKSTQCDRIRRFINLYEDIIHVQDETILDAFKHNGASFYATLEKLIGSALPKKLIYSSVPEQLASEIDEEILRIDEFRGDLRTYQEFGVKYVIHQKHVLLGDEMGLGKTIQAIASMVHLYHDGAKYLVVCPASVMINWVREIEKFCKIPVVLIYGKFWDVAFEKWNGIAVTNYETMYKLTPLINEKIHLDMLIVDEAQYIKNPDAKRTKSIRELKEESEYILMMTGTPIENKTDEMCELLQFVRPDLAQEVKSYTIVNDIDSFREKLAPVYLRRKREDVLTELPTLTEIEEWCEMTEEDLSHYQKALADRNFMGMRRAMLEDNHSGKLERMKELCEEAKENGSKVVVFSFFRDTLDIIAENIDNAGIITGEISVNERQMIIDDFQNDDKANVLLCQIIAGGTGLNLQSASIVIFAEPQIKPSLTKQAMSRVYRMGQTNPVFVYHLLTENSIDDAVMKISKEKQEIFNQYADDSVIGDISQNIVSDEWIQNIIEQERTKFLPAVINDSNTIVQ